MYVYMYVHVQHLSLHKNLYSRYNRVDITTLHTLRYFIFICRFLVSDNHGQIPKYQNRNIPFCLSGTVINRFN